MPNQRQNQEHLYNQAPKEVAIASSIIPYPRDDYKALFLGYRACGLSPMEAMKIIGITKGAVSQWRHNDPIFASLEQRLPEIRKELSKEYIEIEFFRNFRLALEQDYRILKKALNPERDEEGNVIPMTRQEHDYLVKLRSQYNPQQLQILEAIVSGAGDGFNFAHWVAEHPEIIQVSRTDTVTVKR
jgi:hypothetical protein